MAGSFTPDQFEQAKRYLLKYGADLDELFENLPEVGVKDYIINAANQMRFEFKFCGFQGTEPESDSEAEAGDQK